MRKFYFMLLIFCGIILVSCNNKTDSLQFEKEVMYEIFPALMDSVWINASRVFVPPPMPEFTKEQINTLYSKKKEKKRFNEELAHYKKSNFRMLVVILDKTVKARESSQVLKLHFKNVNIAENIILDTTEYKLDRKKINNYQTFKFIYLSKIPKEGERLYYNELGHNIRGVIYFTRIQFDDNKKYGVMYAGLNSGQMRDNGYRIFLKKIKTKWVVDKIEDAWTA